MLQIKRAYEEPSRRDGYRVLIDRLWPRGIRKDELEFDEWAKELAPSAELRKSFGHDPAKWHEFRAKYRAELRKKASAELLEALAKRALRSNVTLIYSAKDEEHNNAVVVKDVIDARVKKLKQAKK